VVWELQRRRWRASAVTIYRSVEPVPAVDDGDG
jgi:hypothetical protein